MTQLIKRISPQQQTSADNNFTSTTWVEINTNALRHNVGQYKSIIGSCLLAPVIKSNAYGHGMALVAQTLDSCDAADVICVVNLSEAIALRMQGIKKPLLVLSILNDDLHKAALYDIALVVYDLHTAQTINQAGKSLGKKVAVHIKVDTGLSRLGLLPHDAIDFAQSLQRLPFITIQGIFTHFANSENKDQSFADHQVSLFASTIESLEKLHIAIPLRHASCSAAITGTTNSHFTMARTGIGIYGLWPSLDNKLATIERFPDFSLQPVLTWKTTIIQVKEIPAGSSIGYDRSFITQKASRIAILPIGYWDGYDRRLSNKGIVLINGQLAPVVGRIAMNLTMVDISNIQANSGDHVTLLGNAPEITANDIAAKCNTINYEVVTKINPLLPRLTT